MGIQDLLKVAAVVDEISNLFVSLLPYLFIFSIFLSTIFSRNKKKKIH